VIKDGIHHIQFEHIEEEIENDHIIITRTSELENIALHLPERNEGYWLVVNLRKWID